VVQEIGHPSIIDEHPSYGYRRPLSDFEKRTSQTVNHKRLRRLLGEHELGLSRRAANQNPSPVQEILDDAAQDRVEQDWHSSIALE
jgi:hypothetical protein